MSLKQTPKTALWKLITGRIFAVWALVLFIGTMIPAIVFYLPCFLLNDPAKAYWHRHVSRIWMWIYLHLIGCPLSIKGKENFEQHTNYVIICNHNSLMDVPVSTPFMPRANKTIAKKSFAKIPVFGWIYTFGSVLVDRKSDESRRRSYDEMKKMLAIGLDMVIYPEGTRNRTDDPLKIFMMALSNLLPIQANPFYRLYCFIPKKYYLRIFSFTSCPTHSKCTSSPLFHQQVKQLLL